MTHCACCYNKDVAAYGDICPECQVKVDAGELTRLKEQCTVCKLHWNGYYSPTEGLEHHTKLSCEKVQTGTLDPDIPYAQHIKIRCAKCGMEGWSAKNIAPLGCRNIFWFGEGKECDCPTGYFEPVLSNPEKWKEVT